MIVEINLGSKYTEFCFEIAKNTNISEVKDLKNKLSLALFENVGNVSIKSSRHGNLLYGLFVPKLLLNFNN